MNRDKMIEIICEAPPKYTMGEDQAGSIADAILAHQAELEAASAWQLIDSAPKDGTEILATHNRGGDGSFRDPYLTFWGVARAQRGEFTGHVANAGKPWWLSYGGEKLAPTPTHWRPLPTPPEKG